MAERVSDEAPIYRIGADENGLGARLGPLTVTAVLAEVSGRGTRLLSRRLPQTIRADLDDSKALVSCHDVSLGEAWARGLFEREHPGVELGSPDALFAALRRVDEKSLSEHCPSSTRAQCWSLGDERFEASEEQLDRVRGHLDTLEKRGVQLRFARTGVVCTGSLNQLKSAGINRFGADLHEMERLVLDLRARVPANVWATCGKVGGMAQYPKFFGPLGGHLHTVLAEGAAESSYLFPQVGTLRFVRDADASDPLVMLASLIGKYFRELLMRRIALYYRDVLGTAADEFVIPSGYHDPVTTRFVDETRKARKRLSIVTSCFERSKDEPVRAEKAKKQPREDKQVALF